MIEHIVLLKMKSTATASQIQAMLDAWCELSLKLHGVREFFCGPNVTIQPFCKGFSHAVVVRFEASADRDAYVSSRDREQLARTLIMPLIDDVCVVDVET